MFDGFSVGVIKERVLEVGEFFFGIWRRAESRDEQEEGRVGEVKVCE